MYISFGLDSVTRQTCTLMLYNTLSEESSFFHPNRDSQPFCMLTNRWISSISMRNSGVLVNWIAASQKVSRCPKFALKADVFVGTVNASGWLHSFWDFSTKNFLRWTWFWHELYDWGEVYTEDSCLFCGWEVLSSWVGQSLIQFDFDSILFLLWLMMTILMIIIVVVVRLP